MIRLKRNRTYKPGVIKRRMTGIALGALFIAMWILQGWPLRTAIIICGAMGVWEVYSALEKRGAKPVKWVGIAYVVLSMPVCHLVSGFSGLFFLTAVSVAGGMCAVMLKRDIQLEDLMATLFPIFYPGILFSILLILTYIEPRLYCTMVIGLTYVTAILNDMAAYEIGTIYGRRKLCPKLSPQKTVEGALAGLSASILVSAVTPVVMELACAYIPLFAPYAADLPAWWLCAAYGAVAGVMAQYGDLCASMVKRYCGVKDYGSIFPGHGGVMDRLDSILFNGLCAAAFFVLFMR